jgi:hypothetical protein
MFAVQRWVQDSVHVSEYGRVQEAQRTHGHAVKAAWLAGDLYVSGAADARELVRVKSTLTSKDEEHLLAELRAAVLRGEGAKQEMYAQWRVSRGRMLHTCFPPVAVTPAAQSPVWTPEPVLEAADS